MADKLDRKPTATAVDDVLVSIERFESSLTEKLKMLGDMMVYLNNELTNVNRSVSALALKVDAMANVTSLTKNSSFDTNIVLNDVAREVEELTSAVAQISDKVDNVDNDVKNIKIYKYAKH